MVKCPPYKVEIIKIKANENRGFTKNRDKVVDGVFYFSNFECFGSIFRDFIDKIMESPKGRFFSPWRQLLGLAKQHKQLQY